MDCKNRDDQNMYELHCKGEFAEIRESMKKILELLQGNGKPGLKAEVLWCTTILKGFLWSVSIVLIPLAAYYAVRLIQIVGK